MGEQKESAAENTGVSRRNVLGSICASTIVTTGLFPGVSAGVSDPAPDPSEYPDILTEMDGTGSEDDPYIVTDIVDLQAIDGDLDAHYRLGGDIDASDTETWNSVTAVENEYLGVLVREDHFVKTVVLSLAPVELGSEAIALDGEQIGEDMYDIDYDTGLVEISQEAFGDSQEVEVTASYRAREERRLGFDPIGTRQDQFLGTLNGQGHEIRGLTIDRPGESPVGIFGMFGGLQNGEYVGASVGDLKLPDVDILGEYGVGGLAGSVFRGTITDTSVGGVVDGSNPESWTTGSSIGGLVGRNSSDILNSSSHATVSGSGEIGGLTGENQGTITRSVASGPVMGRTDPEGFGGNAIGGLVGHNHGEVDNSAAHGEVQGRREVGGLVGLNQGEIRTSSCAGTVTGENDRIGGLVGLQSEGSVRASFAAGDVDADHGVGGLVGTIEDGAVQESGAFGDVTGEAVAVGGLVGSHTGSIRSSFGVGDVTGRRSVGGLVGQSEDATTTNSFAGGGVSGEEYVGALVGEINNDSGDDEVDIGDSYWNRSVPTRTTAVGERTVSHAGTVNVRNVQGVPGDAMRGSAAETSMTRLDFDETWRTRPKSFPTVRGFHTAGIQDHSLSPTEVRRDATFAVSVVFSNPTARAETMTVEVVVGDRVVASTEVTADAGIESTVTVDGIDVTDFSPGEYEYAVRVRDVTFSGTLTVVEPPTPTPTPTETSTAVETTRETATASQTATETTGRTIATTAEDGTGFDAMATIAGLAGSVSVLKRRFKDP